MRREDAPGSRWGGAWPFRAAAVLLGGLLLAAIPACSHRPYPTGPAGGPKGYEGSGGREGGPPRPLDPLTPQEEALAVRTALADPRVRELTGGEEARVGTVLFLGPNKAESGQESPEGTRDLGRLAAVLLYSRVNNSGIRAVVDLRRAAVVEASRIEARGVPLGQEDLEEAWALAQRDGAVRELLGQDLARFQIRERGESLGPNDYEVQGMAIIGTTTQDPCWQRRCLGLLFRRGVRYLQGVEVVVDLTSARVMVRRQDTERREP